MIPYKDRISKLFKDVEERYKEAFENSRGNYLRFYPAIMWGAVGGAVVGANLISPEPNPYTIAGVILGESGALMWALLSPKNYQPKKS